MDITVKTVSRKLTKALVNQMQGASLNVLLNGTVLGFLVNVRKGEHKTLLLSYGDNYYTMSLGWKKYSKNVCRPAFPRGNYVKEFENEEKCQEWWNAYSACLAGLDENQHQIYI